MHHTVTLEKSLAYTGVELQYYSRTGISLNIPAAKCETPINILIQVINDDYSLPSQYQLMPIVSDMYRITISAPLPVPVMVRMEHCAVVDKSDSLVHIVANGSPPYRFNLLYGGTFPVGESYGEIKLQRFSILATLAQKLGWRMYLSVQVFYRRNNTVTFVATKNIQSRIQAIKEKYTDAIDMSEMSIQCDYTTKAIALNIPTQPQAGWAIVPKFQPPQILTKLIQEYRPGKTPPAIELKLKWTGTGEPKEEDVEISVEGCSVESFILSCKPTNLHSTWHPIGQLPDLALPEGQPSSPPSLQSTASSDTSQFHTPPLPEGIVNIVFFSPPSSA